MANTRKRSLGDAGKLTTDRITRDDAIEAQYAGRPSLRALCDSGRIDRKAFERAERLRAAGPPERRSETRGKSLRPAIGSDILESRGHARNA
jgi:hypothetical protein